MANDDWSMFGIDHDGDGNVSELDDFTTFMILEEEQRIEEEEQAKKANSSSYGTNNYSSYSAPSASGGGSLRWFRYLLKVFRYLKLGIFCIIFIGSPLMTFTGLVEANARPITWFLLVFWWVSSIAMMFLLSAKFPLYVNTFWYVPFAFLVLLFGVTDYGAVPEDVWRWEPPTVSEFMWIISLFISIGSMAILSLFIQSWRVRRGIDPLGKKEKK